MTPSPDIMTELAESVEALYNEELASEQAQRLERILADNPAARREYVRLTAFFVNLQSCCATLPTDTDIASAAATDSSNDAASPDANQSEGPVSDGAMAFAPISPLQCPFPEASGFFASGWPVAYLIATVIFSIALTIAALVHTSQPGQLVSHQESIGTPNPQSPIPNPSSIVARITGMVDCVWEKKGTDPVYRNGPEGAVHKRGLSPFSPEGSVARGQGSAATNLPSPFGGHHEVVGAGGEGGVRRLQSLIPNPQSLISLGDTFALKSGLLELTYDTGAKVILQGPVTYEVESPTGGYLSLGKLTARLEKRSAVSGQRSENPSPQSLAPSPSSNPQSLIPNPSFAVRTPTATVTDLGTEFGVEVDKQGVTRTETFAGLVRVASVASRGSDAGRVLRAGQAAVVHARNAQVVVVNVDRENQQRFVRVLAPHKRSTRDTKADAYANLVLSLQPVVYYRMERSQYEKERNVLVDSAPGARHGVLRMGDEFGLPYLWGWLGQSLSLRQGKVRDYAFVPHYPQTNTNQLSFSAWIMAQKREDFARIIGTGASFDPSPGFRVFLMPSSFDLGVKMQQSDGSEAFVRAGETHPLPLNSWQHVAFVVDGSTLRLYCNGQEVARAPCRGIAYDRTEACLGIGCLTSENDSGTESAGFGWQGRLDEVALFHHTLTPEQVQQLSLCTGE